MNDIARPLEFKHIESNPTYLGGEPMELEVIGDGSCLLHAICNAFCTTYITQKLGSEVIDPMQFVRKLRTQLAEKLDMEYEDGKTYYEFISRGALPELGKSFADKTLQGMQAHFDSRNPLGVEILEYISMIIDYDLFLIDKNKGDVYITGDEELYQKGRSSIVIIYNESFMHYTTGSIKDPLGRYWTVFPSDHNFIQELKRRIKEITK